IDCVIGKTTFDQLPHALFGSAIGFGDGIEDLVALVVDAMRCAEEGEDCGARRVCKRIGEGEQARDVVIHARALSTIKTGPPLASPFPRVPRAASLRRGWISKRREDCASGVGYAASVLSSCSAFARSRRRRRGRSPSL